MFEFSSGSSAKQINEEDEIININNIINKNFENFLSIFSS